MIKQLTAEEQESLHLRYRNNELFRHWSPLLCRMEWQMQELDPITLWYEAEKVILKLRNENDNRGEMIQYIFGGLLKEFMSVKDEYGNDRIRTKAQAECSASSQSQSDFSSSPVSGAKNIQKLRTRNAHSALKALNMYEMRERASSTPTASCLLSVSAFAS